jgi:hypothetical protein
MQLTQRSFIIIRALQVSGGISAHHQELIKLYVLPWLLSCIPAVYRWCGWVEPIHTSGRQQESMTIPKAAHTVL